ncbi:Nitrogen-fixing_NifU domain-containing protein [Hexamita inflata]|uniref:Nitrogen-fixing NifU domain-containing protein n=1 Tax=Hexamita inflata TaxID=28002 RepID=A0AA86UK35_9EUKA|nr:Nitrogen-fixing NifU domain-containing protein [Hexamita inflata]
MEQVPLNITELQLKPKLLRLMPNVKISPVQQTQITDNLKLIPKIKPTISETQLDLKLSTHWDSVKDQVYEVLNRALDPDYVSSVEELKTKLTNVPPQKQIEMVIKSVVNPVLLKDGGSCEFVSFAEKDGQKGVQLRFQGACGSCPSSQNTLKQFIEKVVIELMPGYMFVDNV